MNKKRILLLGGSKFQVPSVLYAKKAGYYVITCDYCPDNPGHQYADEYYNVSTTNMKSVLKLAINLGIDGIVAYASDPAAQTAAFIAEKLNLPGNPYKSVKILNEKDLFRIFLKNNNFYTPFSRGYEKLDVARKEINKFKMPIMIKPVDSSGSKGVGEIYSKDDLDQAFEYAIQFSRVNRVVMEEYVIKTGPQIHGDAFIADGKVVFCYLGDHHYNEKVNPFVPYSTTLPSIHSDLILQNIETEIQRLIDLLGIKFGAFNIEVRVNSEKQIFLIEVGPRNGGNFVPQLEEYASGFNMTAATIKFAMGNDHLENHILKKGYFANYVIHSGQDGLLKEIQLSDKISRNIIEKHIFKKNGDFVNSFQGSNATIGILLLRFNSREEMIDIIDGHDKYIKVIIAEAKTLEI